MNTRLMALSNVRKMLSWTFSEIKALFFIDPSARWQKRARGSKKAVKLLLFCFIITGLFFTSPSVWWRNSQSKYRSKFSRKKKTGSQFDFQNMVIAHFAAEMLHEANFLLEFFILHYITSCKNSLNAIFRLKVETYRWFAWFYCCCVCCFVAKTFFLAMTVQNPTIGKTSCFGSGDFFKNKNKRTIQLGQICSYIAKNTTIYLEFSQKTWITWKS